MAPFPDALSWLGRYVASDDTADPLADISDIADIDGYTDGQLMAVQVVSLSLGTVSVLSAMLAFYWFLRMKRGFRHDLIMLLIQSDMLKSLWFAIYPIFSFIYGPVPSSSSFCQVSGFFLSAAIEASDIAVLLIALHTGLNIFRPRHTGGELGLYPYRRVAFAAWAVVPLVLAALAFANRPHGYESDGRMCYLPDRPQWPRMVLSWVPRYVIFATIIITYGYVYYYVSILIRRFGSVEEGELRRGSSGPGRSSRATTGTVPPTPPIKYHGLLSSAPPTRRPSAVLDVDDVLPSAPSRRRSLLWPVLGGAVLGGALAEGNLVAEASRLARKPGPKLRVGWKWPHFGTDADVPPAHHERLPSDSDIGYPPMSMRLPEDEPALPDSDAHGTIADHEATAGRGVTATADYGATATNAGHGREMLALPAPTHRREVSSSNTAYSAVAREGRQPPYFWHRPLAAASSDSRVRPDSSSSRENPNRANLLAMLRRGPASEDSPQPDSAAPAAGASPRLRPGPSSPSSSLLSDSSGVVAFLTPSAYDVSGLSRTREKIRKQLRLMFVYPLMYMLFWLAPMVLHVWKSARQNQSVPFAVSLLSLASLCVQGAVNAWLFSTREKPWRHESAKLRRGGGGGGGGGGRVVGGIRNRTNGRFNTFNDWGWPGPLERGPGRTRDEMMTDSRQARRRRRDEMLEERHIKQGHRSDEAAGSESRPTARQWWDAEENTSGRPGGGFPRSG